MTSKKVRLAKATIKVVKNVGIVAGSAIITGILTKRSREAVEEIGEGAKMFYNIAANTFQKW